MRIPLGSAPPTLHAVVIVSQFGTHSTDNLLNQISRGHYFEASMSRYPVLPLAALATSFGMVALLLSSPLASPPTRLPVTEAARPGDEAAIYRTLIDDLFATFPNADMAVISDSTTTIGSGDFAHRPGRPPDGFFEEAATDYLTRNQAAKPVQIGLISTHHPIRSLVPGQRLLGSFDTLAIAFSQVGFSTDHSRAVVYFMFGCGLLCAQGDFVWLKRDAANSWYVVARQTQWVS
jgi:hypothetical protein